MMIFEVCVDSVEGALAAKEGGAQRIELCDNLVEGGTTPSLGMVRTAQQQAAIAVNVIIRPRGGDFYYSPLEFEVMRQDILAVKALGVNGVVIGLLLPDGSVDAARTRELIELARPLSVTFHRAFDLCRDPYEALEVLVQLGVDRILTSGQQASALKGAECIARLVQQAGERIIILGGGGVNAQNAAELVARTGLRELHFAARKTIDSPMQFRNITVGMGKSYQPNEYIQYVTDAKRVNSVVKSVKP